MATEAHPARPALRPRLARSLLLFATLAAAACGFVYELVIIALGTYLVGNSVEQVSIVLATFVSAAGVGSLLARPLLARPVPALVGVECAVALVGGCSGFVLYSAFAWLELYGPVTIAVAATIGALVGAELPLLISLVQRIRRETAGRSASDLLAADYAGALVAGVGFPFVLLPLLGQLQSALAVGVLNAAVGLLVLWIFRAEVAVPTRAALAGGLVAVIGALAVLGWSSGRFEVSARQALYDDPILTSRDTPYQSIVLTEARGTDDLRLFLNGDLQFSSVDEYRYHEALVHPAMAGRHERVLILGGGDGLALREVLRYPDVREVVEVELDPAVIRLAREDPRVRALNRASLDDPRVSVVIEDAFTWLRGADRPFDVVIADFPDPDDAATAKLYSLEAYALMARILRPGGRIVAQAGSPFFAPHAFWAIERTMRAAGLGTVPYHVDVPSFGDWGFHLAAPGPAPALRLRGRPGGLRFLDPAGLRAAAAFPRDRPRLEVRPSTLDRPRILEYQRRGWRDY